MNEEVGIKLDNDAVCREELQRVSNAISSLTQAHTELLEDLERAEEEWELVEAAAFNGVKSVDKGLTATQIKSLALEAISMKEETAALRKTVRARRAALVGIERQLRSYEKRMGAAQSALRSHAAESAAAGYGRYES